MKKILISIIAGVAFLLLWSHFSNSKTQESTPPTIQNKMIVGTNAEFAPFSFIEDGQIVGFDIDVAKDVCKRLGKEIELKDMPFDGLIPELTLGHVHFVAAGMSSTLERAKRVLFTKPYLTQDSLCILTIASESAQQKITASDLVGKIVVVNEGFTADLYMSKQEGVTLLRLPTTGEAFLALKSKRADAFITAKSTLIPFFKVHDDKQFQCSVIENTADDCALAISKQYPKLQIEIQNALDAMIQDGSMQKLKAKWKLL